MSATGYKLSTGADLSTIFSPYVSGNPQAAVTGYRNALNQDLCELFNKYVSGDKAAPTGYQISTGDDLNTVFRMPGWVWNAVGTGLNGTVRAIAFLDSSNIFVGGGFTNAGGIADADYIARWNSNTNTWSALGSGTNGQVNTIAVLDSSNIFVGGSFTLAGGVTSSFVAKWNNNTNAWSALRTGLTATRAWTQTPGVYTIACLDQSNVFIGGVFDTNDTFTTWSYSLIRWNNNTSSWSYVIGGYINTGSVFCIAILDAENIFISGSFGAIQNQTGYYFGTGIVKFNNLTSTLSNLLKGLNNSGSPIYCISILNSSNIFVGGVFRGAFTANGTNTLTNTTNIARWDNNTQVWSALGSGIRSFALDTAYAVYNICVVDASTIFVGGIFPNVNNIANTSYMAQWNNNTSTWTALSERPGNSVWTYYKFNDKTIFVGGDFTASGNITSNISKYVYL